MNTIKYIVLLSLVSGCAPSVIPEDHISTSNAAGITPITIAPELSPFIQRWNAAMGVAVDGISFVIEDLEGDFVGMCMLHGSNKTIKIDRGYFNATTDDGREQLLFHEIGHCLLNLGHRDGVIGGCPTSIMNTHAFGASPCYGNNKDALYKELL